MPNDRTKELSTSSQTTFLHSYNSEKMHWGRGWHCVKRVRIHSYSGPYFLAYGLNTERYSLSLHIQSECGKIRTRIAPNTDTFYAVWGPLENFLPSSTGLYILNCRHVIPVELYAVDTYFVVFSLWPNFHTNIVF